MWIYLIIGDFLSIAKQFLIGKLILLYAKQSVIDGCMWFKGKFEGVAVTLLFPSVKYLYYALHKVDKSHSMCALIVVCCSEIVLL